jgi:hypothetical protein
MKTLISVAVLLAVAGLAQADAYHNTEYHDGIARPKAHHDLARKPYTAPVVKTESFEGAVVKEEVEQPKKLNVFMLDRRPYSQKAAD